MLFYCCILEHAPPKNKRNSIITVPSYKFVCDCVCMCYIGTCSGRELGCAQKMLMNLKKQSQDLFYLLLSFCYNRSEGYIGCGSERQDLYCYSPWTVSIQLPSKTGVCFHHRAHKDKETILVEMGLFLNLLASGWGNRC